MNKFFFALEAVALFLFVSCGNSQNDNVKYDIIPLQQYISQGQFNSLDESDWIVDILWLMETDSTLLDKFRVVDVYDSFIAGYDRNKIYYFTHDGNCKCIISKSGEGPEEYMGMLGMASHSDGKVDVLDYSRNIIQEYASSGKWLGKSRHKYGDVVCGNDELLALSYPEGENKGIYFYWLDRNLEPNDSLKLCNGADDTKGFVMLSSIQFINDIPSVLVSDTLFAVDRQCGLSPSVVFDLGQLKMPEDVEIDFSKIDEQKKYIGGLYSVIWQDLCFLRYNYDGKMYFDIWEKSGSKLLFRNMVDSPEDMFGFPLKDKSGHVFRVWPQMAKNGFLIGTINQELQKDNVFSDSNNPGIFIISSEMGSAR